MDIKDKIIVYIYNKSNQLENEMADLQRQLHYQPLDNFDIFENMQSRIRIEAFNEFVSELFKILMYCDTKPQKPHRKRNKDK